MLEKIKKGKSMLTAVFNILPWLEHCLSDISSHSVSICVSPLRSSCWSLEWPHRRHLLLSSSSNLSLQLGGFENSFSELLWIKSLRLKNGSDRGGITLGSPCFYDKYQVDILCCVFIVGWNCNIRAKPLLVKETKVRQTFCQLLRASSQCLKDILKSLN